jgi:predicted Zn-dependent protease
MERPELESLIEEARKLGAGGCEALWERSEGHALHVEGRKVHHTPVTPTERVRITAWLEGGRRGVIEGASADAGDLLKQALLLAADAPESPHEGPVDRLRPVVGGLGIADRRYAHLERDDREEVLLDAVRGVAAEDKRVRASHFRYSDRLITRRFVNSRGVALEESSTRYDAWGEVHLGDVHLTDHIASRAFASVASYPYGTALARRAVALQADGERLDGVVKAMLPPRVVARVLEAIGPGFTPERLSGAEPFFLYAAPDEPAPVDERLHLLDDGQLPGGLHTRSFDDRGVVPIPRTFLREGRADQPMVPPTTARATNVTPTGHVWGEEQRTGNLGLRGGTRSMNASYTDADTWALEVDDLDLSGLDLATGVCEVELNALVMKSNEVKGAMRGVRARIDLKRMLSDLVRLCSDTDRIRHVDAPALFVDGLELL